MDAMRKNHFSEAPEEPEEPHVLQAREIAEQYREKARLDFDNEFDKAMNWWFSLDKGVASHYTGTPRARLLEMWNERTHQTHALASVLFSSVDLEHIYPTTPECRALVLHPDLAVVVNRPGKIRAYGFRREFAAWNDLNDRLRTPRVGANGM